MRRFSVVVSLALAAAFSAAWAADEKKPEEKADPVKIGPAKYPVPKAWKRQRPRNEMRAAQFEIPLADGDEGKAEFIVFYFQGQGGGVQENIKRWVGMFEEKDGKEKVEKIEAAKMPITTLDVSGTYKDKPFPMAPSETLRKNYRMLAAVVETPDDGPYFFRLVGPKKTIEANAAAFKAMLKGATLP